RGHAPRIVVGHDYRTYSPEVRDALVQGLVLAGVQVRDIGLALSPMVYWAARHLGTGAAAMVTASHNPNGWTGVKTGFAMPLAHGPQDMAELRDIALGGHWQDRPGGSVEPVQGVQDAYL